MMKLYLVLCLIIIGPWVSSADPDMLELQRDLVEQKQRIEVLEKEWRHHNNPAVTSVLTELLTKRNADGYDTIAFSATLGVPFDSSGHNNPIPFDAVKTNEGNGYSPTTGVFIAPRNGIYMLFASVTVNGDDGVHAQLQKNGLTQCACVSTHYASGSCMVIIPLDVGDKVWVKEVYGTHVRAEHLTTFNGMLVI
ncbi:EMILIN-1-like [Mizuhopecten yessoensis]|nr:EMILIN-1-like [Mizuhopecten yessoensis]